MTGHDRRRIVVYALVLGLLLAGVAVLRLMQPTGAGAGAEASTGVDRAVEADSATQEPDDPPTSPTSASPPIAGRPGDESTGTSDATALRPHAGGTLDEDGLVLEDVLISEDVILSGSGQTLRNVRVEGQVRITGGGTLIEDTEVGALIISGGTDVAVRRLEVFGHLGKDGMHVSSDTGRAADITIEDSWIHSPAITPESHYDGIQVRGVDRLVLRGNHFDLGEFQPELNAAIFLQDANGGNADVLIEGNWIGGGGYTLYLFGDGIVVRDNIFGPDGEYGLRYPEGGPVEQSDNIWLDDGSPAQF